jgi:transcriptional regulator with XRE-family HTH domain
MTQTFWPSIPRYGAAAIPDASRFVIFTILMGVGTGGNLSSDFLSSKDFGYRSYESERVGTSLGHVSQRSPASDLTDLKEYLGATVTDIAYALKVSRQAIYDWQAGKALSPENADRLSEMARAGLGFHHAGFKPQRRLLLRALTDGKNALDLIREGKAPEPVLNQLIALLKKEANSRQQLQERFKDRKGPIDIADMGIPSADEEF